MKRGSLILVLLAAQGCSDDPAPTATSARDAPPAQSSLASTASAPRDVRAPSSSAGAAVSAKEVVSHTSRPEDRPFSDNLLATLNVKDGFAINAFATGLGHARMLEVAEDGAVYLTRPNSGDVMLLRDKDGDGKAEEKKTAISGLEKVHGIVLHDGQVYLAGPKTIWVAPRSADGTFGKPKALVEDLPDGGQHPNRTMAFGEDGKLYVSIGSTCNACEETNPEAATIITMSKDGKDRKVFAKGLRNTIGFDWHPVTKELWGMDHGSDDRGDDLPPEELNRLLEGKDYGWPYAFGEKVVDPIMKPPKEGSKEERAAASEGAILGYQAHSAPIGMAFYRGKAFPEEYRDDAFFASRGSWNRLPPTGYKVVRVVFEDGKPTGFEDFVTGWLLEEGKAHFGRLAGLAIAKDGSILVSEDTNGVVYRIAPIAR
jgi:glucose/arabinose dehydrogenase